MRRRRRSREEERKRRERKEEKATRVDHLVEVRISLVLFSAKDHDEEATCNITQI